jgi:hypothetical protein
MSGVEKTAFVGVKRNSFPLAISLQFFFSRTMNRSGDPVRARDTCRTLAWALVLGTAGRAEAYVRSLNTQGAQ